MIAIIEGMLAGVKLNEPMRGQDFKANQTLGIVQVGLEGDVETVPVKDEDLSRKYEVNKPIKCRAKVIHWQNGNRAGISCKLLEVLK